MIYFFTIKNWTPVLTNQWMDRHWSVRLRMKDEQAALLGVYKSYYDIPDAVGPRKVFVVVRGYPRGRLPDDDAADKLLRDCLKEARLIVDDDRKNLPEFKVEFIRDKTRSTEFMLEDV